MYLFYHTFYKLKQVVIYIYVKKKIDILRTFLFDNLF